VDRPSVAAHTSISSGRRTNLSRSAPIRRAQRSTGPTDAGRRRPEYLSILGAVIAHGA
jgi:hypothetical protein